MEIWPQMPVGCLTDHSGERLTGSQEVESSILFVSTKRDPQEHSFCGLFV